MSLLFELMDVDETSDAGCYIEQFRKQKLLFRRACHHIRVLNRRIEEVQGRYDRAFRANMRSFHHSYGIRLVVLEEMMNMFYEYATGKANKLAVMKTLLIEQGLNISSSESDSSDDDL